VDAGCGGTGEVRRLSVLVVHNHYQQAGGEDAAVEAEVTLLRRHGHRVIEFTRDNAEINAFGPLRRASLAVTATWDPRVLAEVRALVRQERPVVAHCHNLMPLISPAVYYACRSEGVPVVQTLHNFRLRCPAGTMFRDGRACNDCDRNAAYGVIQGCYRQSRTQTAIVAATLGVHRWAGTFQHAVDAFSAPSIFCVETLAAAGIPRKKMTVRSNFLAEDPGKRHTTGDHAIFVGRLCEEKGVRRLVKAWKRLPHVPLLIVGDGPLREELERIAPANIRFAGALPRKHAISKIKGARFLVFPSIAYETFGMVVLEAAACGVPTVGSRLGAIPELVDDGCTGLLFDPDSADELAETVAWAWTHPDDVSEMGHAARRRYLERYTAEHGYASLMTLYASVGAAARA